MVFDVTKPKCNVYIITSFTYANLEQDFNDLINAKVNILTMAFSNYIVKTKTFDEELAIKSWNNLTLFQKNTIKSTLNGVVMMSIGGSTGSRELSNYTSNNRDEVINAIVKYAIDNNYDGIDIDYEVNFSLADFCIPLINLAKKNNLLISAAPQADSSVITDHLKVYVGTTPPGSMDWWNVQYYNQTDDFLDYKNTMISYDRTTALVAVYELTTGKKIVNPDPAERCSLNPDGTKKCPDTTNFLPPYKILMGSVCELDCKSGLVTPTIVQNYVTTAKNNVNDYKLLENWFSGGGVFVWQYCPGTYYSRGDKCSKENSSKNLLSILEKSMNNFNGSGPSPPPTDMCSTIKCNNPYGECDPTSGSCTCYYGYTGINCTTQPSCGTVVNTSSRNYKSTLKQNGTYKEKNIIYLIFGIILLFLGIIGIFFANKQQTSITIKKYKKYINICSTISIISGIILIILYTQSGSNPPPQPPSPKIGYQCNGTDCVLTHEGSDTYDQCIAKGCPTPPSPKIGYQCNGTDCILTHEGSDTYDQCIDKGCGKSVDKYYSCDGTDCNPSSCRLPSTNCYKNNSTCDNLCKPTTGCGSSGQNCLANEVCMQKDNTRGNSPNGICVPCSSSTPPTTYYYCDATDPNTKTCKTSTCTKDDPTNNCYKNSDCGNNCTNTLPPLPPLKSEGLRNVAYLEGWNPDGDGTGTLYYGNLVGYTHIVFAFAVPYHYYNGGCSAWCTPWAANDKAESESFINIINKIKQDNPNIKVILSFGGWGFNHFNWEGKDYTKIPVEILKGTSCNRVCKTGDRNIDDPSIYQTNPDYCTPLDKNLNIQPSEYCYGSQVDSNYGIDGTAQWVAKKLIDIVTQVGAHGVDIDIEDTCDFAKGNNSGAFQFMKTLTIALAIHRHTDPNFIITQAPMNAYVITDKKINKDYTDICNVNKDKVYFSEVAKNYVEVLKNDLAKYLDFISVQFYNGPPDSSDPNDYENVITSYKNIANYIFGGDTSKVVIGMCTIPENPKGKTTCMKCVVNNVNQCWDGKDRANKIVKPLFDTYKNKFGGVMSWASLGDQKNEDWKPFLSETALPIGSWKPIGQVGTFSNPMNIAMGKSNLSNLSNVSNRSNG